MSPKKNPIDNAIEFVGAVLLLSLYWLLPIGLLIVMMLVHPLFGLICIGVLLLGALLDRRPRRDRGDF